MEEEAARLRALRGRMIARLLALDGVRLNGHLTERLPGNGNVSCRGAGSESLLLALDLPGGAASSVRVSLGRWATEEEIDGVLAILPGILEQVRSAFVS